MTIQFKKGVLELCVLSMLRQEDQYGYDVAMKLAQSIDVADGSIYLVLRRLKQEDYVSSYLEESSGGPPRKYYVITRKGEAFLDQLIEEWGILVSSVNSIINGSAASEATLSEADDTDDYLAAENAPESLAPVMVGADNFNSDGGTVNE